jgi:hypothetical protein
VEAVTDARRPGRVRRERSLTETLLSITLGLEAAMMFFASLVVFGLDRLDPDWLALVYGAVFIVVLVIAAALQRYAWGVWFGAVLQLAIIATGLLEPMMFLVGAAFLALWVYCFVRGRQIDRQKAAWLAAQASGTPSPATSPEGDTP